MVNNHKLEKQVDYSIFMIHQWPKIGRLSDTFRPITTDMWERGYIKTGLVKTDLEYSLVFYNNPHSAAFNSKFIYWNNQLSQKVNLKS